MIKGISHIVINTVNMDKALEFYGKTLGFAIISESPFWAEVKVPGSEIYLGLHLIETPNPKKIGTTEVTFKVEDIQEAEKWLKSEKTKITREANEIAPGRWIINFDDPDGNPLSVYSIS